MNDSIQKTGEKIRNSLAWSQPADICPRRQMVRGGKFLLPLRALLLLALLVLTLLLPASCAEDEIGTFDLPTTEILSVRKNWAVVSLSYLPLYEEPSIDAPSRWHARRGEVFEVLEQSLETEYLYSREDYWFRIGHDGAEGWAFGAGLRSYASREEALDAASRLSGGEGF
jgi:hypothetical protein